MMATLRMATTEHPAAGPLAVRAYADPIASGHRAELGSKAYSLQLQESRYSSVVIFAKLK